MVWCDAAGWVCRVIGYKGPPFDGNKNIRSKETGKLEPVFGERIKETSMFEKEQM
jgi:hypothetical protein